MLGLFAVEGISYVVKELEENWQIDTQRQFLLEILGKIEREPSLMGASPHLLCVGAKT